MTRRRAATVAPLGFSLVIALAGFFPPIGTAASEDAATPRTELWADILRARVNPKGEVAYRSLVRFDGARLRTYVESLGRVDAARLGRDDAVAFWINAYNAGVVLGIVHGGSPETLAGRARLYHWFQLEIGNKGRTLDEIEHLLAPFAAAEPRIHFALCNGTRSSPPLAAEPYTGDGLDSALAAATRRFVNDARRNRIDGDRFALSQIFEWHRADFEREAGSLLGFVAPYLPDARASALDERKASADFLPFDWTLNAADGERPF